MFVEMTKSGLFGIECYAIYYYVTDKQWAWCLIGVSDIEILIRFFGVKLLRLRREG